MTPSGVVWGHDPPMGNPLLELGSERYRKSSRWMSSSPWVMTPSGVVWGHDPPIGNSLLDMEHRNWEQKLISDRISRITNRFFRGQSAELYRFFLLFFK